MAYKKKKTFRSLNNYKEQQAEKAKEKGVYDALMEARTLTQARKIVYGKEL